MLLRLFISYACKDETLPKQLGEYIALSQREGLIAAWPDRQITAGQEWAGKIKAALEESDIIFCLVSAGFLASPYWQDKELMRVLERHEAGEAVVIPVIVRDADWHSSPLGRRQALPEGGKSVTSWSNKDQAFTTIAQGSRQVALQWELGA